MAHDKLDETHQTLMKYGGKNNENIDQNRLKDLIESVRRAHLMARQTTNNVSPVALCRTPKLRKWSAVLGVNWYGLKLYKTNNKRTNKQTKKCIINCNTSNSFCTQVCNGTPRQCSVSLR